MAQTLEKDKDNLILSSYSVSSVLSMILHGAKGGTSLQLRQGLGLGQEDNFLDGFKDVLPLLKSNENFTLNSANRIYHALDNTLDSSYITSVQKNFLAEPIGMDFGKSEESRKAINDWVEEQTNKKITELIASGSINGLTKLVLVNAIHFKGDWNAKFDQGKTTKQKFHVTPQKSVDVDMMFIKEEFR